MNLTTLNKLINKLNTSFQLKELGIFTKKMSAKIDIYASIIEGFQDIVVFYKDDESIDKINFVSDKPILSINDLTSELGEFQSGYSFRDDITKISFDKQMNLIKIITTKKDNKLEITEDKIIQVTPQGIKSEFKLDDKFFNSICFVFN